ncbi:MAG: acyl-ACP--UDP-N-acetylglucosamine O-acyltransferase [Brevinematia bacterium]
MTEIHPTAILGENVKLGENVRIKPYTVINGNVEIGDGCEIGPLVHITGWVKIGQNVKVHSFAAIGEPPQDYSFNGEDGLIEIGSNSVLREGVTVHTPVNGASGEKTIVGESCFLMANSHVAHNAKLGKNVVLANGCLLAGYVIVEDYVFLSGNVAVHQHCRVGEYSIAGGLTKITQDVPPYSMAEGDPAKHYGINSIGLKRRNIEVEDRNIIKEAYKIFYDRSRTRTESLKILEETFPSNKYVKRIVEFIKSSKRGIIDSHYE